MNYRYIDVDGSEFEKKYNVSKLVGKLLASSNLDEERIQQLLDQDMTLSISNAKCVADACKRIMEAKRNGDKVFVGGDYDADGICSTAIMKDVLDRLGIVNGYYIPDRFKEGYGLRKETVQLAIEKGYKLIITVDNGVKASEAIEYAKANGVFVIVTDHHQISNEVRADIVVHPDYMESAYKYCSGAGVALQISRNLLGNIDAHTELAAIAAIGDVMPLYGENRKIVKKGLDLMAENRVPAIDALIRKGSSIDEITVAFQIVPKLNSVGRMNDISNVNTLVPFLLSTNTDQIAKYAGQLNLVNERRKELSAVMAKQAENFVTSKPFEVIYDKSFHEGIVGLVAGKLANKYHKPFLVLAMNDGVIKGSGRSVPGFNLFDFFSQGFEFEAFGGHEQAVGISIKEDYFETFSNKIERKMNEIGFEYEEESPQSIVIDLDDITFDEVLSLESLMPLPKDVFQPVFTIKNPPVTNVFHSPKVTKYSFGKIEAVQFGKCEIQDHFSYVTGRLSLNRFRNQVSIQLNIENFEC